MNSQVLEEVLSRLGTLRQDNEREEQRRQSEVLAVCPRIGDIQKARREAVMKSVYAAFSVPAAPDITQKVIDWNREIRELLIQNGFPEDYLEPVFHCGKCEDTGYCGTGKKVLCTCAKAMYAQLLEKEGDFEREQTFETFNPAVFPDALLPGLNVTQRAYAQALRKRCETYADALPHPAQRTLLLYGGSGLGKTFLLRSIHARAREKGVPALCVTANQFIRTARQGIFQRSAQEELDSFYETDVLLLDDLGTEPMIENVTVEELFNLINERQSARLCTVLSTNLTLNELKNRYTERIASRLFDRQNCQLLQFLGQDIRMINGNRTTL